MNEQLLVDAAETLIASNLWNGILIFIFVFVSGNMIKRVASIINEFVIIRTDTFGIGSTIYHNKQKAVIKHIGLRRIEIFMVESKESKYVLTSEWKKFELVVPDLNEIK